MKNRTSSLWGAVVTMAALLPVAVSADNFSASMTPDQVTAADATSANDFGTCRDFNTSPFPVVSDGRGKASFRITQSPGGPELHFSVVVQQSAGVNDVFVAIGSADDTWCDGRPRHYLYGGPGLGGPVAGVNNGLVMAGSRVAMSEFDSAPGAGDGLDNFITALHNGNAFVVARVNSLGPYFRGEMRGQISPSGMPMASLSIDF